MKSIHVIYGAPNSGRRVRAYRLAAQRLATFVHEIDRSEDVRLVLASRYDHCIAILEAGDEDNARRGIESMAKTAHAKLCDLTFEPSPAH